jgi:MinD-like ATPase involved in chromosome partitioning or flagellar assembly
MTTTAVCSGKGSPGATLVAVNLAAALASTAERVLLIDLDLSGGDIAAYLGLDPRKGLQLLNKIAGPSPSPEQLHAEIQEFETFGVIGGMPRPSADSVDSASVSESCRDLGGQVILDAGRIPGPSLPALSTSDRILVVVRADVISVLGAERCLGSLEDSPIPKEKVSLVMTAHRKRRVFELAEVGRALGHQVAGVIPYVPRAARRALETQRPIKSGPGARAFEELAARVHELARPSVGAPKEAVGV